MKHLKRLLPYILIFHPRGPFKKAGPYLALFLGIIALPFLLTGTVPSLPTSITLPTGEQEQPQIATPQQPQPGGGLLPPPDFDPLRQTGDWAITQTDADRAAQSWAVTRRIAADIWEAQLPEPGLYSSFYCGCPITRTGTSSGEVDLAACAYESPGNLNRARRLEWEHVVPASFLGQGRTCWASGAPQCVRANGETFAGRECCELADPLYQMMSNDPVNLVPSIGEVNGMRSNYPFADLTTGTTFGPQCQTRIDTDRNQIDPGPARRGDVARIYAYMSRAYGIPIPQAQADVLLRWMQEDPVSVDELRINQSIQAAGHRPNPLVMRATDPR